MQKLFFILFICLLVHNGNAQPHQKDSLKTILANVTEPKQKFDIIRAYLERLNTMQADNVDSALCIELLKIAQQERNDSMLAISYNWIGAYFSFTKGDNVSALEYFFKGIPLAEKSKDKRRISSLYFDIAIAYDELENFEEAFKNNAKGGENLPDKTSPLYDFMLAQYLRGVCVYYIAMKQTDSALHYVPLMNEITRKINKNNFTFSSLFLSGAAYDENNDIEMADLYFKRANAMSDSIQLNGLKTTFYLHYINFLLGNKRIEEAKKASEQELKLAKTSNNNILKLEAAGFMRQIYDSLHQTDSAYFYSRMEAATNALIFNQNNINKMQALAFNEQIRNIEEEAKAKQAAEVREQNIQYALIALGIIIFISIFLLLSRSIIVNEKWIEFLGVLGLLIVFEFINLFIHPYISEATHDSPIFMLIILVIVAALLIPLHHRLEKWIKEKMVEKNKKIRLEAAKKIIEKLEKK